MRRVVSGLVFAVAVAGLSGCGSKTEVKPMPGWAFTHAAGISIQLPADLKISDLSSGDVAEIRKQTQEQFAKSPEMQKLIESLMASGSMKLVGMMPTPAPGQMPNSFNLVVQPASVSATSVQLIEPNRIKMKEAALPGSLTVELRDFKAGQAAYFQFDTSSGLTKHTQTTYLFVKDSKQFALTFSCAVTEKDKWSAVAEAAVKTLQIEG